MVAARLTGAQPIADMTPPDIVKLRAWWPFLLPALMGLAMYWPTLGYGFVFDDLSLIAEDGPRRLGTTWLAYRPLRHLSYLFDHSVGGGAAWAYHLSNIVLHSANATLVALIAVRVGAGAASAVIVGMLFVAHPLAVEAAAYVAGRRDLLALFFTLTSLLLWVGAGAKRGRAAWALLAMIAAALSKESGLVAVALCAIASLCGLGPNLGRAAAPLVLTAAVSISTALLYGAVGPYWVADDPAAAVRIAGALSAHYASALVMPVELSIDHPELVCSQPACANLAGPLSRLGIACIVALVALSALLVARVRDAELATRGSAFATAGLALALAATAVVIGGHEPGADRHAYPLLALLAVSIALVGDDASAWLHSAMSRRIALTLAILAVAACVRVSEARMSIWQNEWTLWGAAVEQEHVSARSHHNMGRLLAGAESYGQARRHFRDALAVDPGFSPAVVALAALECERGRYRRASHRFEKARVLGANETDVARVRSACDSQREAG